MNFITTALKGSYIIDPIPIGDNRGWFMRTFCKKEFEEIGHNREWVQLNHSFTSRPGSIRGMHFQEFPHQEIKLVRCISGSVFDVIVDLRADSETFLQWLGVELSGTNKKMLYIPAGFAHGFQALEENTELIYHHSEYYHPESETGVRFNDPAINIQWPLDVSEVSHRDNNHTLIDSTFKGL